MSVCERRERDCVSVGCVWRPFVGLCCLWVAFRVSDGSVYVEPRYYFIIAESQTAIRQHNVATPLGSSHRHSGALSLSLFQQALLQALTCVASTHPPPPPPPPPLTYIHTYTYTHTRTYTHTHTHTHTHTEMNLSAPTVS